MIWGCKHMSHWQSKGKLTRLDVLSLATVGILLLPKAMVRGKQGTEQPLPPSSTPPTHFIPHLHPHLHQAPLRELIIIFFFYCAMALNRIKATEHEGK